MSRDLILDVVARKNSKDLLLLAAEFEAIGKSAEASGKKIDKSFSGLIDQQIAGTRKELAQLRAEFAKTGDLKIGGDISGLERNLKSLEKIAKSFGPTVAGKPKSFLGFAVADFKELGESAGKAFGGGFGGIAKTAFLTPQGLAVTATAASTLGVVAGGAIITGIGLAGIGAGVALQLHDAKVQAAIGTLKSDVSIGLKDASKSFAAPLAESVGILDKGFKDALPGIEDTFKALAPQLTGLAKGTTGFLSGVTTGLEHVAIASKPLVDDFSRWLPTFGNQLGSVFDEMAAHSKEALQGLHLLEDTVSGLTVAGRELIPVLSTISNIQHELSGIGPAERIFGVTEADLHAAGFQQLGDKFVAAFSRGGAAADDMAGSVHHLGQELGDLLGNQLSVDEANDRFRTDLLRLKEGLDLQGASLSQNTLAGEANRQTLEGYIGDAQRAREAAIQHAGGVNASKEAIQQANTDYDKAINNLVTMGTQAGLSKKDLEALAGNYFVNVQLAIEAVDKSGLKQNLAPHDVNRFGSAGPPKRALGGPALAGMPYIVGEKHAELFVPNVSGQILPRIPAPVPYKSFGGRGGGTGPVLATLSVGGAGGGTAIGSLIGELIRTGQIQLFVDASGAVRSGV